MIKTLKSYKIPSYCDDNRCTYVLKTILGAERGRIDIVFEKNSLRITRFCVALEYRGLKQRYGKQLLNEVITEAGKHGIAKIVVIPKPEELYDDVEEMDLLELYRKYKNLGFDFEGEVKEYNNQMFLNVNI